MSKINKAGYDEWARTYDTDLNSTVYVDELHFSPRFLNYAPCKVLEIGCGTGRHTMKLAQAGHEICAIDLSEQMLQIAIKKLIGHKNVEFICGDFLDKSLLNSHQSALANFDLAIMNLVLEHIESPKEALSIIAGLLAPNGQLLISDIHHDRMVNGSGARYFDAVTKQEKRMHSYVHLPEAIKVAAQYACLETFEYSTIYGTSDLANIDPSWEKYCGMPMINIWGFQKTTGTSNEF